MARHSKSREEDFILQQALALKYLTVHDFILDFSLQNCFNLIWLFSLRKEKKAEFLENCNCL